jgi:hypothetical protein
MNSVSFLECVTYLLNELFFPFYMVVDSRDPFNEPLPWGPKLPFFSSRSMLPNKDPARCHVVIGPRHINLSQQVTSIMFLELACLGDMQG